MVALLEDAPPAYVGSSSASQFDTLGLLRLARGWPRPHFDVYSPITKASKVKGMGVKARSCLANLETSQVTGVNIYYLQ